MDFNTFCNGGAEHQNYKSLKTIKNGGGNVTDEIRKIETNAKQIQTLNLVKFPFNKYATTVLHAASLFNNVKAVDILGKRFGFNLPDEIKRTAAGYYFEATKSVKGLFTLEDSKDLCQLLLDNTDLELADNDTSTPFKLFMLFHDFNMERN